LSYDERFALRKANNLEESFAEFKRWMLTQVEEERPKSLIAQACTYAIGQWDGFNSFLNDGRVELSTNLIENAIRPVTLGRKNYLFKGSQDAAQRGAMIYSIINTANKYELNPVDYIKHILKKLPAEKSQNI